KAETNSSYASIVPYLIANVYYKQKRYDELLSYTASLKNRTGLQNMREISMLTAEAHYFKGDYEKAAVAYEEFLQNNPSAADGSLLFRAAHRTYDLTNRE